MLTMDAFSRADPFPSWFANALGRALSVLSSQFVVSKVDATHVQVVAGAGDQAVVLSIAGLWRWSEVTIGPIAHPGGAAGTYPIFATCKSNNITNTPQPNTDNTDYSIGLQVLAPGATPTIVAGTVDHYRHVADAVWDGAQIVRVDELTPPVPVHGKRHAAGGPDVIAPADIGAVATGDQHTLQTGDIVWNAGVSRVGAVLADGSAYSRTNPTYQPLFAKIGTTYGAGDGSTTFNVPNMVDRSLIGASGTHPRGVAGGSETMTLAAGHLPPHTHGYSGSTGGMSRNNPHAHLAHNPPINPGDQTWSVIHGVSNSGSGFPTAVSNNNFTGSGLGSVDNQDIAHEHGYSGNTDNGPGASTAFSLRSPYLPMNAFILL